MLETDVGIMMRLLQVVAFLVGLLFMYIVAELEELEAFSDVSSDYSKVEL